jgi:hypothetical protein
MRTTRTWTISLPPELSRLAYEAARQEHRTKSELIREAIRLYLAQRRLPLGFGVGDRVARSGDLLEAYRQRATLRQPSEAELRREFQGVRRLHDRLRPRRA